MANIICLAKSGYEWTNNNLMAYNITVTFQDATAFFGKTPLPAPAPAIDQGFLTALTDNTVNDTTYCLLTQLDLAMSPSHPKESAVDDFAVALFHYLHYTHLPQAVCMYKELWLIMYGEHKYAKPDICIINRRLAQNVILLVQENK